MNFSEFIKLLGAEPRNSDPETLRARQSGPEFEQAALDALVFEEKLESALDVIEPGDTFLKKITSLHSTPVPSLPAYKTRWFAIAASVLVMVGVAGVSWRQANLPNTIEEYLPYHYGLDGLALIEKASADFDADIISTIMAGLNMSTRQELNEKIRFIKLCPTLQGLGIHMVVQTDEGLISLIYMPGTMVEDRRTIKFGEMQAYMVALETGTAAIIGRHDQSVSSLDLLVRNSLSSTI